MKLYVALSAMMFLQYAIWGAWAPVLAARLLGPLKFNGKQTGWIYGTLPLACIVAPLAAGQVADKYLNTEWIMAAAHLAGAVLMFLAARKEKFRSLFIVMLLYSTCYAATLPLVNSLMFRHVVGTDINVGHIFMWAPIAWALVGYALTGWRWKFRTGEEGRDCLYLAAMLSALMAVICLALPKTEPLNAGAAPIIQAFALLKQSNFLVFILVSMTIAGLMQFYFLGTAQFMQDMDIPSKNVPAAMAIAQATQAIATLVALMAMINAVGYKWTLTAGACCWLAMYAVYVLGKPRWLVVASQSLHGLAYVWFMIAGQMLANTLAPPEIQSSMQALIFAATTGVGLFIGTQAAGIVMDRNNHDGQFVWSKIFLVPCLVTLAATALFIACFSQP